LGEARDIEVRSASPEDAFIVEQVFSELKVVQALRRGGADQLALSPLGQLDPSRSLPSDKQILLGFQGTNVVVVGLYSLSGTTVEPRAELLPFCREGFAKSSEVLAAMITSAENIARRDGLVVLDVEALPGDQMTKSTLETLGYRARLLIMHRRLDGS